VIARLAWITATPALGLDEDEPLALHALRQAGLEVDVVPWDAPDVQWTSYDRVVLRSTWDYPARLPQFLAWLEAVDQLTELRNPLPMLRWNLDKHYLADLADAGVPITPTTFVEPGQRVALPPGDLVVKPAVGAGSRGVRVYDTGQHDLAQAHIEQLHADGAGVLVQPLLASVSLHGEWPLIFLDGHYSHAASKRVTLPEPGTTEDLFAEETNAAHIADPEQVAVAQAAIDVVTERFGAPTYARVDLVRDDEGRYCVLELELIEPSLFLPQAEPEALDRLVKALQ
jgi:glutathione synthase/RimK-type ligase-like ATP-grasp enzyme